MADVFSRTEYDIGKTHLMQATCPTSHAAPIAEPLRRHTNVHLNVIDKTVSEMQRALGRDC